MTENILVIGGEGFLGKAILKSLSDNGFKNIASADLIDKNDKPLLKSFYVDVLNRDNVRSVIKDFDLVINCTGQISKPINQCLLLNTKGIENITKTCKEYNKYLIHISTVSVYGNADFATEETILNPVTLYAACKAFSEFIVNERSKNSSFSILRLCNLYGNDQTKGLLAYLKKSFYADRKLEFENDGSLKRYYLNVSDCADLIYKIIKNIPDHLNKNYNIIGPDKYSIKEIVEMIENVTKVKFNCNYLNHKPSENILEISDEKIRKCVDYDFNNNLKDYINKNFITK